MTVNDLKPEGTVEPATPEAKRHRFTDAETFDKRLGIMEKEMVRLKEQTEIAVERTIEHQTRFAKFVKDQRAT